MVRQIRQNHSFGTSSFLLAFSPSFPSSKMSLQWLAMMKVLTPVIVMRTIVPYILTTLLTAQCISLRQKLLTIYSFLMKPTQVSSKFLKIGLKRLELFYLLVQEHNNMNEDRTNEEKESGLTWFIVSYLNNNFWTAKKDYQ